MLRNSDKSYISTVKQQYAYQCLFLNVDKTQNENVLSKTFQNKTYIIGAPYFFARVPRPLTPWLRH